MPFDVPFTLGPFTVDATGRLLPTDTGRFPAFTLRWNGRLVEVGMARLSQPDGLTGRARGVIALRMLAGRVPSTAEGTAGGSADRALARRAGVFATLGAATALLPAGWRLDLLADHSVSVTAEATLEMPTTATTLLTDVTCFLLQAAPYLELLDGSGVALAGMVNTCPG